MDVAYIDQTCGGNHSGITNCNFNRFQDEIKAILDALKEAIFVATGAVDIYSSAGQLVFEGPDGKPLPVDEVSLAAFVAGDSYSQPVLCQGPAS